jgi:hypothetical protein
MEKENINLNCLLIVDIIKNICNRFKIGDFNHFSLVNKDISNLLSTLENSIWKNIAINQYGVFFWNSASNRKIKFSKPLEFMKDELKRLRLWEKIILETENKIFTNVDYYKLWNCMDNDDNL